MCNVMVIYFKKNYMVQRNDRQSISEQYDTSISEQVDQSMIGSIRVDHIIDRAESNDQIGSERSGGKWIKNAVDRSGARTSRR